MPLNKNIKHIYEPTELQCGQAVLAMLTGKTTQEIVKITERVNETTLKDMLTTLRNEGIEVDSIRKEAFSKADLPPIAVLSLETPRCWHWSLYYKGTFLDPEHGVLEDFPETKRKYYWEVKK